MEVEDSAGRTLGQSEAGALARLVLKAAVDMRPLNVQALIVHPAVRFGRARAAFERATRALELGIFRAAPFGTLDELDKAFAAARAAAGDQHVHSAIRAVDDGQRAPAKALRATSTPGSRPCARSGVRDALANALPRITRR